jgi:hypothetical protein
MDYKKNYDGIKQSEFNVDIRNGIFYLNTVGGYDAILRYAKACEKHINRNPGDPIQDLIVRIAQLPLDLIKIIIQFTAQSPSFVKLEDVTEPDHEYTIIRGCAPLDPR